MSLKSTSKPRSSESQSGEDGKDTHPYLVAESEIRGLVGRLDIRSISTVAARFQTVADLTSGAFEERKDQLDPSDLMLIRQIAAEDNRECYRRIMEAILSGLEQGRHGINAAHLTANLIVLLTFRWSPEYRLGLDGYRHRLRVSKLNRLDRPSRRRAGARSIARSSNDQ